jgi:DNA polymerase IV
MTARSPRICCLDLDTFFVSVERLLDPSLEGKPLLVGGGPGKRGVVCSTSYEVRALGVKTGMPLSEALRLAPHALVVPARHGVYGGYAARVREVLERACPVVQTASIDEFFLDFAGCERLYRRAGDADDDATIERVVRGTTASIAAEVGLPSSAGIATSRPVSKIASGLAKPKGVLLVPAGGEAGWLAPLPVRKYPGIGPVAEQRLLAMGLRTLGELAQASPERLRQVFGRFGEVLPQLARGEGVHQLGPDRPAFREHDPDGGVGGSISNERTFAADLGDLRQLESVLCGLCERVCWRARKRGVVGRTVTLKLRYADFTTISRGRTLQQPTSSELELHPVLCELLADQMDRRRRVRLLGVALSRLQLSDQQLGLFAWPTARVHRAVDAIRQRFGFDSVHLAESGGLNRD